VDIFEIPLLAGVTLRLGCSLPAVGDKGVTVASEGGCRSARPIPRPIHGGSGEVINVGMQIIRKNGKRQDISSPAIASAPHVPIRTADAES